MKHKTKRIIAIALATVLFTDICMLPMCSLTSGLSPQIKPQTVVFKMQSPLELKALPKKPTPPSMPKKPIAPVPTIPIVTFRVTAYTAVDSGQDGRGITASGKKARVNHTIAASSSYPFGTVLEDVTTGEQFTVEDRGGAINGNRLDLYVGHSNTDDASEYGVKYRKFKVIYK